jgi:hypothetical protein
MGSCNAPPAAARKDALRVCEIPVSIAWLSDDVPWRSSDLTPQASTTGFFATAGAQAPVRRFRSNGGLGSEASMAVEFGLSTSHRTPFGLDVHTSPWSAPGDWYGYYTLHKVRREIQIFRMVPICEAKKTARRGRWEACCARFIPAAAYGRMWSRETGGAGSQCGKGDSHQGSGIADFSQGPWL